MFEITTNGYVRGSRLLVRRGIITIAIVGVVVVGAGFFGRMIPAGFIPEEDQGILGVNVQLPPGASLERTNEVLKKVEVILSKVHAIESYQTVGGYGVVTNTFQPNYGTLFARLKPWEERHDQKEKVKGIMADLAEGVRCHSRSNYLPIQYSYFVGIRGRVGLQLFAPGSQRVDDRRTNWAISQGSFLRRHVNDLS